jgi:hypothetical protein
MLIAIASYFYPRKSESVKIRQRSLYVSLVPRLRFETLACLGERSGRGLRIRLGIAI